MSKQTRVEKQQARVDAFVKQAAKQLQKLIDSQEASVRRLKSRHADAIDDWWCTIPQGMIPLINAARAELSIPITIEHRDGPNGEQASDPDLEA